MIYDVILLTEAQYINPEKTDPYIKNVLYEDDLVLLALKNKGLKVAKKDWADPIFDWSSAKTLLFRSTWDYFHRFDEFLPWLKKVAKITRLINPAEQILWNMDKHYLIDLKSQGVPTIESHYIKRNSTETLAQIHKKLNWSETVIKPTVSGAARHTYRLNPENYAAHETRFADLIKKEDFILQPFQKNVPLKGEVSHIIIHGKYSHSILKLAKKGDYRVQDDHGGTTQNYKASAKEISFAENTVKACTPIPLYARVDLIWDNKDALALIELELIEPELWFRENPMAATLLANAIFEYGKFSLNC